MQTSFFYSFYIEGIMYIPRLRYINDAVKEIKENDADFQITYHLISHFEDEICATEK